MGKKPAGPIGPIEKPKPQIELSKELIDYLRKNMKDEKKLPEMLGKIDLLTKNYVDSVNKLAKKVKEYKKQE